MMGDESVAAVVKLSLPSFLPKIDQCHCLTRIIYLNYVLINEQKKTGTEKTDKERARNIELSRCKNPLLLHS